MKDPLKPTGSPPSGHPDTNGVPDGYRVEEAYFPNGTRAASATTLIETLGVLWQGKWIILIALVLTIGAMIIYLRFQEPEYEAASLLAVGMDQASAKKELALSFGESMGGGNRNLNNEVWFLRNSLIIAERVAERLDAMQTVPGQEMRMEILLDEDGQVLPMPSVVGRLKNRIQVYPAGRDIDGLQVVGTSPEPAEAALIANLYAEEYIARTQESQRASFAASRVFLEEQEGKLLGGLETLEGQISSYMSQQGAAALDQEASSVVQQIAELEAMRDQTRIELQMKGASLEALGQELAQIEPKLVQRVASGVDRDLRQVQQQIADLNLRLEQIYKKNPELRSTPPATGEVADLLGQMERLQSREQVLSEQYVEEALSVGGIDPGGDGEGGGLAYVAQQRRRAIAEQIDIRGLEAKQEALNNRLQEAEGKLRNIPVQSLKLAQLQRARQSSERLYVFIVEKLQEIRIAEEAELGYSEIVLPAFTPGSPVRPNARRSLMMAFIFGLGLGIGLVLLRNRLDTRVHHPGDLREMGHHVIGVIHDMGEVIKQEFGGVEHYSIEGHNISTALTMLLSPMSPSSEAYRRLRTNIQFSLPDTVVQTMLFTSPEKGEGKSTTVMNLAVAMAQSNRRTLVVDCDLRRPRTHRMLDVPREPGLSDLLFSTHTLNIKNFETVVEGLYLIPAGRKVPNPTELVGSKRMRDLIEHLKGSFDVIIFDTPPVLAFSDAMLLSTQCDATIIVAAADRTERGAYEHAVEVLEGVGAQIVGSLLNRFDPRSGSGYGYRYGYGYKYGYKYGGSYRYYQNYYADTDDSKSKRRRRT